MNLQPISSDHRFHNLIKYYRQVSFVIWFKALTLTFFNIFNSDRYLCCFGYIKTAAANWYLSCSESSSPWPASGRSIQSVPGSREPCSSGHPCEHNLTNTRLSHWEPSTLCMGFSMKLSFRSINSLVKFLGKLNRGRREDGKRTGEGI